MIREVKVREHLIAWARRAYSGIARALLGALTSGVFNEADNLAIVEEELDLPRWKRTPMRVALLSDLHVGGRHIDLDFLDRVVAGVTDLNPELILLAGDFLNTGRVGDPRVEPELVAEHLARLDATLGVYAVLGNHDWKFDGPRVRRALETWGIQVLENESLILKRGCGPIRLVGIGDKMTHNAQPAQAFREAEPVDGPTIVFTHSPDVFPEIEGLGSETTGVVISLAGHTHGGQVKLPWLGTPIVPSAFGSRFVRGHIIEGDEHYYVTSGIGTSRLPIRFGVRPEVLVLTLC